MKNTNNEQEKMTFASDKLKILRKRKKLTQQQIADELSINRVTYTNWEKGNREPSFENLIKLSEVFNVSVDKLLGVKIENNQTAIGMFELLEEYLDDQCDNISFLESDYRAGYEQALENGKVFEFDLNKYKRIETDEAIRYEYEDDEEYHWVCIPKNRIVSISEYTV